jgi:hypothetical protein
MTLGFLLFVFSFMFHCPETALGATNVHYAIPFSNVVVVGHVGGKINSINVSDSYFYVASNSGFQVINRKLGGNLIEGEIILPDSAFDVAVHDNVAYVASFSYGLQVVDISNPSIPKYASSFRTNDAIIVDVETVEIGGKSFLICLDLKNESLLVFSLQDPLRPKLLSTYHASEFFLPRKLSAQGNKVLVLSGQGLTFVECTNPLRPAIVFSINGYFSDGVLCGGYVYAAADERVVLYDANGAQVFWERPLRDIIGISATPDKLCSDGKTLLVSLKEGGAALIDVTDKRAPTFKRIVLREGKVDAIQLYAGKAYFVVDGSRIVSVGCPDGSEPPTAEYDSVAFGADISFSPQKNTVYIADGRAGLKAVKLADDGSLGIRSVQRKETVSAASLHRDSGRLYVADGDGGILVLDEDLNVLNSFKGPSLTGVQVLLPYKDRIFSGTDKGLFSVSGSGSGFQVLPIFQGEEIMALCGSSAEQILLASYKSSYAQSTSTLSVLDPSTNGLRIAKVFPRTCLRDIQAHGGYLYLALGSIEKKLFGPNCILVLDPARSFSLVSQFNLDQQDPYSLSLNDGFLSIANGHKGLLRLYYANVESPRLAAYIDLPGRAYSVVETTTAIFLAGDAGLFILKPVPSSSLKWTVPYSTNQTPRRTFYFAWESSSPDAVSFDVEYRPHWSSTWYRLYTATTQTFTYFFGSEGTTYYLRVRARDRAGNTGPWSPEKSVTVPYDNTNSLFTLQGTSWFSIYDTNRFRANAIATSAKNQTFKLSSPLYKVKEIVLVVTRRPDGGKAVVYLNGSPVATIDTYAATTRYRSPILIKTFTTPQTVTDLRVVTTGTKSSSSTGTKVEIDGVGIKR